MKAQQLDLTSLLEAVPKVELREPWQDEWQDMPEFVQLKQEPYAQVIVRFHSQEDLDGFAKLIGQKLTRKTKSIWHPFKSHWGGEGSQKEYADEP